MRYAENAIQEHSVEFFPSPSIKIAMEPPSRNAFSALSLYGDADSETANYHEWALNQGWTNEGVEDYMPYQSVTKNPVEYAEARARLSEPQTRLPARLFMPRGGREALECELRYELLWGNASAAFKLGGLEAEVICAGGMIQVALCERDGRDPTLLDWYFIFSTWRKAQADNHFWREFYLSDNRLKLGRRARWADVQHVRSEIDRLLIDELGWLILRRLSSGSPEALAEYAAVHAAWPDSAAVYELGIRVRELIVRLPRLLRRFPTLVEDRHADAPWRVALAPYKAELLKQAQEYGEEGDYGMQGMVQSLLKYVSPSSNFPVDTPPEGVYEELYDLFDDLFADFEDSGEAVSGECRSDKENSKESGKKEKDWRDDGYEFETFEDGEFEPNDDSEDAATEDEPDEFTKRILMKPAFREELENLKLSVPLEDLLEDMLIVALDCCWRGAMKGIVITVDALKNEYWKAINADGDGVVPTRESAYFDHYAPSFHASAMNVLRKLGEI